MSITFVQKVIAQSSRGFVVAFHDIAPESLEGLMDALTPIRPIHLSELVERSRAGRSTVGLCAITVDDGVARTVHGISRLCRRRGWPATFYLPIAAVETGEVLPFQWLRTVLPLLAGRRVELRDGVIDFTKPHSAAALTARLERMWHTEPISAYRPFTMQLVEAAAQTIGVPAHLLRPDPGISWKEVAELSKVDLFRFESHGVSHAAMSALTEDDLIEEMQQSRDLITEHTGRVCRHLAYPFGSAESIGALAPLIARRFYDSAVTMDLGHVDAADPWRLPRIPLYAENSGLQARLKVALKCSRFLPAFDHRESLEGTGSAAAPPASSRPKHRAETGCEARPGSVLGSPR